MSEFREPTERDRFWLDHEAAIKSSGQTAKDYAAAQDLSLHSLYQARKRLRALAYWRDRDPYEPTRSRHRGPCYSRRSSWPRLGDPPPTSVCRSRTVLFSSGRGRNFRRRWSIWWSG